MEEVNGDSMDDRIEVNTKDEDFESGGDSAYAAIQVILEEYPILCLAFSLNCAGLSTPRAQAKTIPLLRRCNWYSGKASNALTNTYPYIECIVKLIYLKCIDVHEEILDLPIKLCSCFRIELSKFIKFVTEMLNHVARILVFTDFRWKFLEDGNE